MDIARLFVILSLVFDRHYALGIQGPVFLLEPPSQLTFSNTTGSQVSCSAHDAQVAWILQDGTTVAAVPGLRQSLGNGTLYFPPFQAQSYRKDIHSTVYRCRASNAAGTILSREVNVRAVISQHYEVQVYRAHVLAGNTAVLTCVIPAFVKDLVIVSAWFRDDSILLPGFNAGGRLVVTSGTGDLHIRSARSEDGLSRYSCLTVHSITQERKRSPPAILTVTEPTGSMPPRLAPRTLTSLTAERGSDIHLACSAQGHPQLTFNWFREHRSGQLQSIISSARFEVSQEILHIKRVELEDSGRWTCKVSNQFGEQRLDTHLTVTAHLSVHVIPQLQVINSGESATFNCTVSGSPVGLVQWYRNGEPLAPDVGGRLRLLSTVVLAISSVTRHDRGMYQCVVRNDRESAQGSAELRLGDTMPELQYTFIEQALRPGPQVSLRCSATGTPPPQFIWNIDGEPVTEMTAGHRYAIGQYVDHAGDVISHLNITNVRVEDGGLYSCRAANTLGYAEHAARLNIYGPPFVRAIGPVKAVAGSDVTLHCPYSGYPISGIRWERRGQTLPSDVRHRIDDSQHGGALKIGRLDPATDTGFYTCFVTSRSGEMARSEMQLIVHSPPILEPFSFPSSLQEGGRAQITCSVTSGDMPIHFAWYKDGAPVSASLQIEEHVAEFFSMLVFKEVTSRHSGAYTCIASNSAARVNYTAQLMVKVAPQWVIEPQDVSTLLGNSVTIDCDGKGFPQPQITWLKGQGKTSNDYQPLESLHGRVMLLSNGSMWIESISSQDEGHYLCRATNGIGSGLGKVIYIGVNEPVKFDVPAKNVSSKRGDPATLVCQVYGDSPIEVIWSHNSNRLDLNNYRLTITEMKTETGLKSQLSIGHTDREDSGQYKCRAENAFGTSDHIIHLAVQERPDPPVMMEVVEVGSRSVRLSWRRPFDGNSPVLGYMVQYQQLGTGRSDWDHTGALNLTLPVAQTSNSIENDPREMAIVGGLLPATAYTMRMLAVNSIDQSAFTEAVIVKTQEEAPMESPKNVLVQSVGPGELFLTWQVPAREMWNGELLGYIVTWNEQGVSPNNTKSLTVKGWATTKVQLTGLRKFTRYDVTVRAFNSVSSGPSSIPVVGTTQEGVPEAAPQHISCSQISSQSMKISWSPPPASLHGGLIQGYKVFYRPIPNDDNVELSTIGEVKRTSSIETYLHALSKFTNYSIKVLAYTGAGEGVLSAPLFCTTEEDVPGPPANIKAAALTGDSVLVSWLPPTKPNGRINLYTVYMREAGRIGKHISFPVRITEDSHHASGLTFEARSLSEHQLYEFWVSATTTIGEGEPTPIVAQATSSRAPARIASFSRVLQTAIKSKIFLTCHAVGNPSPRTRWVYRDRPITFSPYYEVTSEGHLNIHSADQSLAGNYTCSAKNLFGEDDITYTLMVLLPPGAPQLEVQYTTTKSIRLRWKHPEDGGTAIQGYMLSSKRDTDDWESYEFSPEIVTHTFENLQCGAVYHVYLMAHNRVGNGSPSQILTAKTKGGPPQLAKEKDLLATNATTLQLNLFTWPDGGCPISQFSIEYRSIDREQWVLVSNSVTGEKLFVQDLQPAAWYQLRVSAYNDAGVAKGLYNFATTTLTGERIPMPSNFPEENTISGSYIYKEAYILAPTICIGVVLIGATFLWFMVHKKRTNSDEDQGGADEEPPDEKVVERDNRRNCQQVYTSSPVKGEKMQDDGSGMYEISPYATFSVPGNASRSVTTSTLDYTMQFKTFGHLEDEDHNAIIYPKHGGKHVWHKHRYYNTGEGTNDIPSDELEEIEFPLVELQQPLPISGELPSSRTRERLPIRGDSESEDTSGSPCTECPGAGASYRVPVKPSRDLFRPDSSTESNEISPLAERRHTPRHLGPPRRHHRPTSNSSSEEEREAEVASQGNICLQPPSRFSDSRELSEAECDRDPGPAMLPPELATLLARYQERKEQERREFTIHV